jgi:hypothetical protein
MNFNKTTKQNVTLQIISEAILFAISVGLIAVVAL